jgi:hypothetical protein
MEERRTEDDVVTETSLPALSGEYAESNGSALYRSGIISGTDLETKPLALLRAKRVRWWENSDSVPREGCTERITSLAMYVIRATAFVRESASLLGWFTEGYFSHRLLRGLKSTP